MSRAMTDFRFPPPEFESASGGSSAQDSLAEMAAQIRVLDQAAARAATRVAEAADGLQSELLADLGSSLVARVNELRAECERLSRMLSRATNLSARGPLSANAPAPVRAVPETFESANGEPAPEPAPEPTPDRRRAPGHATPEGVRLAATQMAVAGSSRSEIERCLRIQFGVRDADGALDEIFGTRPSEVR
jgi:uncharacterized membrane protein YccC